MISWLALAGVLVAGLYLLGLGLALLARPAAASRFLGGFASSGPLHYLELALRIAAGLAFITRAPDMRLPLVFNAFGWLLVVTSAALALVPWQWHRCFAAPSVAKALQFAPLLAVASILQGVGVLVAALWNRV